MKHVLIILVSLCLLKKVEAQIAILMIAPEVVLFEQANFSGQSKSYKPGVYLLSDFNDMTSSIRVPAGLIAIIYEHANEKGGYGSYVDLLEDCPDLSMYSFNDKTSYLIVFSASRPGFVYARNRMVNNQFVAGHWERQRAGGRLPDNSLPAVISSLPQTTDPDDIANAPLASQAEIDEFIDIQTNQLNVGVLAGETTKPFYYHHNQPGEEVYKYNKVIDVNRLPREIANRVNGWVAENLGLPGVLLVNPLIEPLGAIADLHIEIKDWLFGSGSNMKRMDFWFPVSEYRKTVCGKMIEEAEICGQDYTHTKLTIDRDVCLNLMPSERFRSMLTNRWTEETHDKIEGEVEAVNFIQPGSQKQNESQTITPRNPLLLQIKKDENVCFYGPWMGDICDINLKVQIPFTDEKIDLGNIDVRKNNEIHPINQLWRKKGNETQLFAIADGTGYFQKKGNGEVEASGLNQRMRFYIAFTLPPKLTPIANYMPVFDINGVGFDFTDTPISDIQPETFTLKHNGVVRVRINDNSVIRNQKTHRVFFDKVRKRPNGVLQGYVVVETEPITKQGGSINIIVKDLTVNNSPVNPTEPPVKKVIH